MTVTELFGGRNDDLAGHVWVHFAEVFVRACLFEAVGVLLVGVQRAGVEQRRLLRTGGGVDHIVAIRPRHARAGNNRQLGW